MYELPSFQEKLVIQFPWYINLIDGPSLFTEMQAQNEAERQAMFLPKYKF